MSFIRKKGNSHQPIHQLIETLRKDGKVRHHKPDQHIGVISGKGQILNHVSDQRVREIFGRRIP